MIARASIARTRTLAAGRRVASKRVPHVRLQSTGPTSTTSTGSSASHLAAGVAGGVTVALIGYGYYHTSGLKTAVQTSKEVKKYLTDTKDTVITKAKTVTDNPSEALAYLRSVAKSYSAFIPGASGYVDKTFDSFDELHEEHGEELDKIVRETVEGVTEAAKKGQADMATTMNIYKVLSEGIGRLEKLGKEAGKNWLEKNPQVKEKFGSGYGKLQSLAGKAGPEGKKALEEVTSKLKEIMSKGKIDDDTWKQVQDLIQDKTSSVEKLAKGSVAGGVFGEASGKLEELFKSAPGAQEIMEKSPHLSDLWSITSNRSEDAKKLAKDTVSDVLKVLEEKGKKAKEIAERAKKDAQKSSEKK